MNSSTMTTKKSAVSTEVPSVPLDCWYALALTSQLSTKPLSIPFVLGELVAVRHPNGAVHVYNAKCAHRGCSLSGGWTQNNHLVCPYHGWQYDSDGVCTHIPALREDESIPTRARVNSYRCEERYGYLWVWIPGEIEEPNYEIENIPECEFDRMKHHPSADNTYEFEAHFSRCIENGIDPTHAPFTHGGSMGKVDSKADLSYPRYDIDVTSRTIFAQMPVKVKKVNGLARWFLKGDSEDIYKGYRFVYPNLLLSLVNFGRFAIVSVQVLVPTGENTTTMLNANYRNFLSNTPGVGKWFDDYTIKTGTKIAFEDDNIVVSQTPEQVKYKGSNEILVESDRILIEFRKMMKSHLI